MVSPVLLFLPGVGAVPGTQGLCTSEGLELGFRQPKCSHAKRNPYVVALGLGAT